MIARRIVRVRYGFGCGCGGGGGAGRAAAAAVAGATWEIKLRRRVARHHSSVWRSARVRSCAASVVTDPNASVVHVLVRVEISHEKIWENRCCNNITIVRMTFTLEWRLRQNNGCTVGTETIRNIIIILFGSNEIGPYDDHGGPASVDASRIAGRPGADAVQRGGRLLRGVRRWRTLLETGQVPIQQDRLGPGQSVRTAGADHRPWPLVQGNHRRGHRSCTRRLGRRRHRRRRRWGGRRRGGDSEIDPA